MLNHGNPNKTKSILISTPNILSKMDLREEIKKNKVEIALINYSHEVKYLGYTFNFNFDSGSHVNEIIKRVNFSLSKINHCKKSISKDARRQIISGVILPIFDYRKFMYHSHGIDL